MPRQPRLVVPGGLYHVMARGIERRTLFIDPIEYREFIDRLDQSLNDSGCLCFAWVLMPNHFHLLVQVGKEGTPPLMRQLMTGYAVFFNRRHRRAGHLFENRYKAILCEKETYLMELIRYIHLNPLRGKIVESLEALENFPWSGHRALLGLETRAFQRVHDVWSQFGRHQKKAQIAYRGFISEGAGTGQRADLMGGGLLRSLGRSPGNWAGLKKEDLQASDERILGSGCFVETVLKKIEKRAAPSPIKNISVTDLLDRVAALHNLSRKDLTQKGRRGPVSQAKAVLIYLGTHYKGQTCQFMGQMTAMTVQSASIAKIRGETLVQKNHELRKLIN
ncbi:MAG: transposase [Elusimicrobia bacterium]|nr:transposase [Elusimicrobiota bacterium]